ncbi:MAG: hypothetical protein J5J00_14980 [Deltaproteobacteria bacterium]|nr:hypothetical protein [Deltaproteobacteria bacterium]
MVSTANRVQRKEPAQKPEADGKLDTPSASSSSKKIVDDFLRKGSSFADDLERLNPQVGDNLDQTAGRLRHSLRDIELLIERGADSRLVARRIGETARLIDAAEKEAEAARHQRNNPLEATEHKPHHPNFSAEFRFVIRKGESFSYNYKRLTPAGEIAYMTEDHSFGPGVVKAEDPSVGVMLRTPDPNDPSKEVVTIRTNHQFKGYLSVRRGGNDLPTYLNVQNGRENTHLNSDAPRFNVNLESLRNAANEVATAQRREVASNAAIPEPGSKLIAGSEMQVAVGDEMVWFRYKGVTVQVPANDMKGIELYGLEVSRKGGNLTIKASDDAELARFDLRVGSVRTFLSITEPDANVVWKGTPLTVTKGDRGGEISVRSDSAVDITRDGTTVLSAPANGSATLNGITFQRAENNTARVNFNYDIGILERGLYEMWTRDKDKRKPLLRFNVTD